MLRFVQIKISVFGQRQRYPEHSFPVLIFRSDRAAMRLRDRLRYGEAKPVMRVLPVSRIVNAVKPVEQARKLRFV